MKFKLIVVGKILDKNYRNLISTYISRIKNLVGLEIIEINQKKFKKNSKAIVNQECILILEKIQKDNVMIILDDKAKNPTSMEFSKFIDKITVYSRKDIVFVIGGHEGFDEKIYKRADHKISFSKMTFNHKMIRLFFLEQLYRAITIIKNHPYHNE